MQKIAAKPALLAPKHSFRMPGAWLLNEQPPAGCVEISSGPLGRVGSWYGLQYHAPRALPCGCTVCVLCSRLLMLSVPAGKNGRGHWWTYDEQWMKKYGL